MGRPKIAANHTMVATSHPLYKIYQLQQQLIAVRAVKDFKAFVLFIKQGYDMQWFHALVCEKLQDFADGKIKKLIVLMPPQHGKSELTTRLFPAYLIGKNPELKIALATYNQTMAANFNRAMQRNIDNEKYAHLFPDVKLNSSQIFKTNVDGYTRTTDRFDIINHGGSVKTVGIGGSLTGEPVDIGIIDDPIKDRDEANSETIRSGLYNWYTDVFKTRLHNNSQQLLIQTRWHEHDLAGRLLAEDNDWEVIKLPALRTEDEAPYDPRQLGEALWESKHSKLRIKETALKNPVTFNSLYQQSPAPNTEILVYKDWVEVLGFPHNLLRQRSWGLDFGKTTGINALVSGAVSSETIMKQFVLNSIVVERECHKAYLKEHLYAANIPPKEIAALMFKDGYEEGEIVWCDHIPQKIAELRMLGIAAFPAVKGAGSISAGIDKMYGYQVYYIGKNLAAERKVYQFVTYDTVITNIPVDADNHLMDASRYCLLSRYFREAGEQ